MKFWYRDQPFSKNWLRKPLGATIPVAFNFVTHGKTYCITAARILEDLMKRLHLFTGLLLLTGCAELEPNLTWLEPMPGSVVTGAVELSVQAVEETGIPSNVVFYLDNDPIAKAYVEDGRFTAVWESSMVSPGDHLLRAKPYDGPSVDARITVAARQPLD